MSYSISNKIERAGSSKRQYRFNGRKIMPKRRKYRRTKKRRSSGRSLGYLRPVTIPVRHVERWSAAKGTSYKWYWNITLLQLATGLEKFYDEFKCGHLSVTYITNNDQSTPNGLCAGVLMDQQGFGNFDISVADKWFTTIASMPGSKVFHRDRDVSFTWRPTEPAAKEWRSYQQNELSYVVATVYFADNLKPPVELGGVLLISGKLYCRGRYYSVATMQREVVHRLRIQPCLCSMELGNSN